MLLATLTITDIAVGDLIRAKSLIGRPVVGVVTAVDPAERDGVVDLLADDGTECWRHLRQIEMVVGADGVTKYATGPGWATSA